MFEMLAQLRQIDCLSGGGHHEENWDLSRVGVGHADGRAHLDTGEGVRDVLDCGRVDIVAASYDEVLLAPVSTRR
ncbi:hypothetical protein ACQ5SK_25485 [Bradyrhizobium japonicum]